jgi:hypothetical protein
MQQPNLCVGRCVTFSTKFSQPSNDLGMTIGIDPNANTMTVTSTSNFNDLLTIEINLLAVLPPTGILNCNFYYPVVNL